MSGQAMFAHKFASPGISGFAATSNNRATSFLSRRAPVGAQHAVSLISQEEHMSKTVYTQEHEWLRIEDDGSVTAGITDYAQDHLGDLVFVQLPDVGKELAKGDEAAVIESVKTAGEILMPVAGTVTEVNAALADEPGKVNEDPMGDGWFFKFKPQQAGELDSLMDEAGYKAYLETLG
jgi:glycine cleavage system H protein